MPVINQKGVTMEDYKSIPTELKELKQWGLFKKELQNGNSQHKYTKIPHNAIDGGMGKSNDPNTWTDFETALQAMDKYHMDGLAFYFANGYLGIDVDNVEGELEEYFANAASSQNIVFNMINKTKSYTELSLSKKGIHIICKGELPGDRRRSKNVEMYENGRFFALTGDCINSSDKINTPSNDDLTFLYRKYLEPKKVINIKEQPLKITPNDLPDNEIIEKAVHSKNGERFKKLMQGDWQSYYGSQSEADLAFANMLAFWTGRELGKMDSIYRQSGLMRPKWDERHGKTTYGYSTLNKAINETHDVFEGRIEKQINKYNLSFLNKDRKKKKKTPPRSWDDSGNAKRLTDNYGDVIRYSYVDKKWYIYNGVNWEQDEKGFIYKLVDNVADDLKKEKVKIPEGTDEKDEKDIIKNFNKFVSRTQSHQGKLNMVKETQHHVSITHGEFDTDPMLFNTQNGYVDLSDGTLHDEDKAKMFLSVSGVEYTENVDCPEWLNFLDTTFVHNQELIKYIQKAVGYTLTGLTKEQIMFVMYGNGRNGKSVFINTLQNILGTYSKTLNAASLMVKQNNSGGPSSDIARLESARAVFSSESNDGSRLDEGLVKQMTGGDTMTARYMYGSDFEFTPKFKLWMATNSKPIVRGTDDGIWRRIVLIPFLHQVPIEDIDKNLEYKLQREQLGILNWAVEGCMLWQKEGINPPTIIKNASNEYRKEMDPIEQFIEENCEKGPDYQISAKQFFEDYTKWAHGNHEHEFTNTMFGRNVVKKYAKKKTKKGAVYLGIRPKKDSRLKFLDN